MIVGGQTSAQVSTVIDYHHALFDKGFTLSSKPFADNSVQAINLVIYQFHLRHKDFYPYILLDADSFTKGK